ncbi:MAG TPA: hypothetical protein VK992_04495 [Candidatus Caenarcaniphilales bacterium]|nr:hypothetical protein [Candidatus Caenarcaniphilales bacterium]
MPTTLPSLQLTEVEGIPTYWAHVPGPLVATLSFRVGAADEKMPFAGITHLIEHLALSELGEQAYDSNGEVDDTRTTFTASGSEEEVVGFLNHVVSKLAQLPSERIPLERDILRSEFEQRPASAADAMRWYRFGPASFGLLAGEQLGLDWLSDREVERWARANLTRERAVLWFSGPPPARLSFELPAGPWTPPPTPDPIAGLKFPLQAQGAPGGIGLSVLSKRTPGLGIGWHITERALRRRLRFTEGVIYDISGGYLPLTSEHAEAVLMAECRPDRAEYLRDAMLEELRRVSEGPGEHELQAEVAAFRRQFDDPAATLAALDAAAANRLLGRDTDPTQLMDEVQAQTPATVAEAVSEALSTALVVAGEEVRVARAFQVMPASSQRVVKGNEFRAAGGFLRRPNARLIVGDAGASVVLPDGSRSTVEYETAAAVWHAEDQVRQLIGLDGFHVTINAAEWRHGDTALALVDATAPPDLVACPDHRRTSM